MARHSSRGWWLSQEPQAAESLFVPPSPAGGCATRWAASAALIAAGTLAVGACGGDSRTVPLVLAAASTVDALDAAVAELSERAGVEVRVSYGPTSTLAQQVVAGAPADLLLAASQAWADHVAGAVAVIERSALAGNRIVVVTRLPLAERHGGAIDLDELVTNPEFSHIAVADTQAVPAGVYARQALERLGLWDALQPRLVPTLDVRAAAALAARGEAEAAFVYATDAAAEDAVAVVAGIDPTLHDPIEYPLLLLRDTPAARRLYDFLTSDRGRQHFLAAGFTQAP